jgi:hypothetical protein
MVAAGLWNTESSGTYTLTPFGTLFRTRLVDSVARLLPEGVGLCWSTVVREARRTSPVRLRRFDLCRLANRSRVPSTDLLLALRRAFRLLGVSTRVVATKSGTLALIPVPASACLDVTLAVAEGDYAVYWGVDSVEVAATTGPGPCALLDDVVLLSYRPSSENQARTLISQIAEHGLHCYRTAELPERLVCRTGIHIRSRSTLVRRQVGAGDPEDIRCWEPSSVAAAVLKSRA